MNLQEQTRNVAAQGRYGDSMLMHVNPSEVRGLSQVLPITTNPETGMPEAFRIADLKPLLPILGSVVGAGILGPALGPVAASSIGSGVAQWAGSGSFEKGLLSALTGAALGSVMKGAAMKGVADQGVAAAQSELTEQIAAPLLNDPNLVAQPTMAASPVADFLPYEQLPLSSGQLNPTGQALLDVKLAEQFTPHAQNISGNRAIDAWVGDNPNPGLGDYGKEIFRGGFGEGMGRLASGVMQPSALAGIGAGMGPLAVMDSQERFEEQIAEQEREDEEKRRLNFLMNPEPILYSAQGGRTGFDVGGDTDLGGDDSGSDTGASTWDEEDWEDSQMKQAPDLQSYLVNPEFLAGFQPETMYFDPFTMNQPVSSFDNPYWEDEDLSPEDRMAIGQTYLGEEYAGSRGGYDTPGFSIAPNQVINPYIPYEGMAPPGLIETPSIPYPDMGGLPVPDPNDPLPDPAPIEPPLPGLGIPGLPGDPGMQPPVGAPPPPAVGEPPPFTLPDDPIDTGIGGGFGIGSPPGAPIGAPPPPPVISPPVGVAPPPVIPPVTLPDDPIDTGIGGGGFGMGGPGMGGPGMAIGAPPVLPPEFIPPGQPPVQPPIAPPIGVGPGMGGGPGMGKKPGAPIGAPPIAPPVQPPIASPIAGGPGMGGPGMGGPGMRPPMPPPPAMPPPMPPPQVAPPIAPPVQPPMGFFGDTDTDDSPVMQPPIAPPVQPPIAPPGFGPRPPGFGGRPGFDPSSLFFDPRFLGRRRFDKGGETAEEVDEGKAAGGMTDSNAEGALVQAATDPMQDPLTQEVIMFIAGESDNQQAINDFIEKYGTEAFLQLRDVILKSIVPGAQTEGLIEGTGQGGMADDIPGMIGDQEQIAVSQDEFIVPADVVSALGDGSSGAGSDRLYEMMNRVRQAKTGGVTQPRPIDPNKVMPA